MFQQNPLLEGKIGKFLDTQTVASPRKIKKLRKQAAAALKDIRKGGNRKNYHIGHHFLKAGDSNDYLRFSNDARNMQDFIYNHLKKTNDWPSTKQLTKVM